MPSNVGDCINENRRMEDREVCNTDFLWCFGRGQSRNRHEPGLVCPNQPPACPKLATLFPAAHPAPPRRSPAVVQNPMSSARTLFEKLWDAHLVDQPTGRSP